VITEGLFAMEADAPDLVAFQDACSEYSATLLVDVAHDLGAMGPGGGGMIAAQGLAGKVDLGAQALPTDVIFAPDGRHAYAVVQGVNKLMELSVDGAKVALSGWDVAPGRSPYGASITPDGNWLINTNVGGALEGTDRTGTLSIVDLKAHRLALSMPVGRVPEHVTMSPDGKYIAVVLANGAANVKSDPKWDQVTGMVKIFAVGDGTLTEVAHADSCHWAQGATFSTDGKLVLQQCAAEREILVYRFDGKTLVQDKAATMTFESRPGAIAIGGSR